jgi:hypothetical protein
MDKTLLFETKDAERPYDYWILICVNCASEVSAPWWRGATRHRADIPGQRECHDIPALGIPDGVSRRPPKRLYAIRFPANASP